MAHFWDSKFNGQWTVLQLPDEACELYIEGQSTLRLRKSRGPLMVTPVNRPNGFKAWVLFHQHQQPLWINGLRNRTGIQLLCDRDEVRLSPHPPWYFSSEELPTVRPFPDHGGEAHCPRCKQQISRGDMVVRCPGCFLYLHCDPELLNCWRYSPTCPVCDQPTEERTEYRWIPLAL